MKSTSNSHSSQKWTLNSVTRLDLFFHSRLSDIFVYKVFKLVTKAFTVMELKKGFIVMFYLKNIF